MAPKLLEACNITHTHPGVYTATLGFALLLNTLIETGNTVVAYQALLTAAQNMDQDLNIRLINAIRIEKTGVEIDDAIATIGNSSSVYHVLPLAIFLCKRYDSPAELLAYASSCGGNADTLTLLCGAFIGARYGITSLPQKLIILLEREGEFENLAEKLFKSEKLEQFIPEKSPISNNRRNQKTLSISIAQILTSVMSKKISHSLPSPHSIEM
jgi:ADP-ribosylglycohydrolase